MQAIIDSTPGACNTKAHAAPTDQLDLFSDPSRWPHKPYCTDDLRAGIYPRTLAHAVRRRYIQANPPHLRIWLLFDVDYPGAATAWEDHHLPPPAWAAANRENGHAHLAYGLTAPVLVDSPDMRQRPMRYLCAVESAMRTRLRADEGFCGLITKNPAHPLWKLLRGPNMHYDLGYLAEHVELEKHLPKRKPEEVGLGRNVTIFDQLRHWAYRNVREYKGGGLTAWNQWLNACNLHALDLNGNFRTPLNPLEVWHIAKSVGKWTYQRFDIAASDAAFSRVQAERGSRGGKAKGAAYENKRASALLMHARGMSNRAIAAELGVSESGVRNWLAGVRK